MKSDDRPRQDKTLMTPEQSDHFPYGKLLKTVSRTFYLSLKLLPRPVRHPISLGYLIARATDTIADSIKTDACEQKRLLEQCSEAITSGKVGDLQIAISDEIIASVAHPGERELLSRIDEILRSLNSSKRSQKDLLKSVLHKIIEGQTLDVARFQDPHTLCALRNEQELEHYIYCVAGSVGEFWTRICELELGKECFRGEMLDLLDAGRSFGKGLQLVNILRDLPADWSRGRCYLPEEDLLREGACLKSTSFVSPGFLKVCHRWEERCEAYLDEGLRYVVQISSRRLRLASALPLFLAIRTLRLIQQMGAKERWKGVKINRSEVGAIITQASLASMSAGKLEAYYSELGRNA
ncbi:MAG: phytoene/squalene synthase family protein [Verrucomicrobiota bacterium]